MFATIFHLERLSADVRDFTWHRNVSNLTVIKDRSQRNIDLLLPFQMSTQARIKFVIGHLTHLASSNSSNVAAGAMSSGLGKANMLQANLHDSRMKLWMTMNDTPGGR